MKTAIKLRGIFSTVALLLLASIGAAYWVGKVSLELNERVRTIDGVLEQLRTALSTMKDIETGQRGFLLTGEAVYLKPYTLGLRDIQKDEAGLRKLVTEGKLPRQQTEAILRAMEEKLKEQQATIEARGRKGLDAALAIVHEDTGRHLMEDVRDQTRSLTQMKRVELIQAVDAAANANHERDMIFLAVVLANLVLLGWLYRRILLEIHRREAAVAETLRQKDILATTLASIGDAVMLADTETKIVFMNAVAEQLTGWKLAEAKGLPCASVFRIINEDSREPVASPVEKVLQSGRIVGLANHTMLIRKDGSEVPIDDSGAPVAEADGRVHGVVLVFRDFSLHKEAEKNLLRAKEEVENASKAKDVFLAALSHELRTPLSPVLAILSTWENQSEPVANWQTDVRMMRRNVELEARIIDDLLDLTRIIRGSLSLNEEKVNLHHLIKATAQMYAGALRDKSLELQTSLQADAAWVSGDPARLQQVLWNLLGNAIKFTPAEGKINISTVSGDSSSVTVRIVDSGIGMSSDTLERLFRPFEQGSEGLARRLGGLGLGLAISKALIERHGGSLAAWSGGVEMGSEFTLTLPATATVAGTPLPPYSALPPVLGRPANLRVLLVEDHADTAHVLATLLRKAGHLVQVCSHLADALRIAKSEPLDFVISDVGLPDGTGTDLIRQIRVFSQVPAIALTGFGMKDDVAQCMEAGFNAHITKPVSFDRLQAEMARVLSREKSAA